MNFSTSYSPLTMNCVASFLQNTGLRIDPNAEYMMGSSTGVSNYTPGQMVAQTLLNTLSLAISAGYSKLQSGGITQQDYDNLISIGADTVPALGNAKPSTYHGPYTGEITRFGFLRLPALFAHEMFIGNTGNVSELFSKIAICHSFKNQSNIVIESFATAQTYLDGIYSNMNDLITSDITGVTLATYFWGADLINSGRAIDLQTIDSFGNPENLLRTLYKNKALTTAVNLALMSSGMNATEIMTIINGVPSTLEQQRKMYAAFSIVMGNELTDVLTIINCATRMDTLADLLNPKKLFPNSYQSLTYPEYNTTPLPTNSKTYYLMYTNGEENVIGTKFGQRLQSIMPSNIAFAADAFANSMMQVKNIKSFNIEKFAQVVAHMENVSDLNINGTSVPTNVNLVSPAYTMVAKGSSDLGKYNMCDFFGTCTNLVYPWNDLSVGLTILGQPSLAFYLIQSYQNLYDLLTGPGPYHASIQNLINTANSQIASIYSQQPAFCNIINKIYEQIGTNLNIEYHARLAAIPDPTSTSGTIQDVYAFVNSLKSYAQETDQYNTAQVLEGFADLNTVGGRSLVGAMREARNSARLGLVGSGLDNQIGVDQLRTPRPNNSKPNATTAFDSTTSAGELRDTVAVTGAAVKAGSLGGSPETMLIPPNLDLFNQVTMATVLPPGDAVNEVTLCNCDCWDLLTHN